MMEQQALEGWRQNRCPAPIGKIAVWVGAQHSAAPQADGEKARQSKQKQRVATWAGADTEAAAGGVEGQQAACATLSARQLWAGAQSGEPSRHCNLILATKGQHD